jgi:thiamine-phosphate pyrophosphorylase
VSGLPRLHVVTDDAILSRADWPAAAGDVLAAGGAQAALHLRGPRTAGRRLYDLALALKPEALGAGASLVLNDRIDVALTVGVRAVQLGRRSLPVSDARRLLGAGASIGVSCHSGDEVEAAVADGADWAFAGTVFPTPSHPGSEGRGVDWLAEVARRAGALPLVAIGGVRADRVHELRIAGAYGVAVVRGVWDAPDPGRAVREYIEALTQ